jgi:hypothetical protein
MKIKLTKDLHKGRYNVAVLTGEALEEGLR